MLFLEYTFLDAALDSIFSILMVFLILVIVSTIVSLFKYLKLKDKKEERVTVKQEEVRKQIKLEDIKDEDMMVAALIATIDYASEIKEDVHLVSIREIK